MGSPPRVRGKLHPAHQLPVPAGITPAHAGKTPAPSRNSLTGRDHPRVCGENALRAESIRILEGSPPRVRGKWHILRVLHQLPGITPACAGKMRPFYPGGDYERGSPPRVRGKLKRIANGIRKYRITPACAGKITTAPAHTTARRDHPRVCGENPAK